MHEAPAQPRTPAQAPASVQACPPSPPETLDRVCTVKRYRKAAHAPSSAHSIASHSAVDLSTAAKSRSPKLPPFSLAQPRLGTPAVSVADLPLSASHSHSRPSFLVKYSSRLPGTQKPAPIFTRKISLSDPCSALGGKAAPSNWSRPASLWLQGILGHSFRCKKR